MDTVETAPVMVGVADGTVDVGDKEGCIVGVTVGAAVMKTSQEDKIVKTNETLEEKSYHKKDRKHIFRKSTLDKV